jgi:hypothetical protein
MTQQQILNRNKWTWRQANWERASKKNEGNQTEPHRLWDTLKHSSTYILGSQKERKHAERISLRDIKTPLQHCAGPFSNTEITNKNSKLVIKQTIRKDTYLQSKKLKQGQNKPCLTSAGDTHMGNSIFLPLCVYEWPQMFHKYWFGLQVHFSK